MRKTRAVFMLAAVLALAGCDPGETSVTGPPEAPERSVADFTGTWLGEMRATQDPTKVTKTSSFKLVIDVTEGGDVSGFGSTTIDGRFLAFAIAGTATFVHDPEAPVDNVFLTLTTTNGWGGTIPLDVLQAVARWNLYDELVLSLDGDAQSTAWFLIPRFSHLGAAESLQQ